MKRKLRSIALALCLAAVAVGVAAAGPINWKISGEMPDFADVHPYELVTTSPDGRYVVYASDARVDDFYELYSVPVDGSGAPVRISGPTQSPMNSSSLEWKVTPDSRRVIYRDRESILGGAQLFSVAIEGGQKVRLYPVLSSSSNVGEFTISPDGALVVLGTEQGIFSVPVEGGEAIRLTPDGYSFDGQITTDSKTVVYIQLDAGYNLVDLYSVPIGGGAPVKLSEGQVESWQLYEDDANMQRVAFFALDGGGVRTLYTVPASGGAMERIISPIDGPVRRFPICADGDHVVFQAGDEAGKQTISSVSLTAKDPITLAVNTGLPRFGDEQFAVSPDCSSTVYGADDSLFVVPVAGGSSVRVSYLCYPVFTFSPDSKHMVFFSKEAVEQPCEVRALDVATKSSTRVNAPLPAGGSVKLWPNLITPDSQSVVYVAEQESSSVAELFLASFDGIENKKLNGSMTFGGNVTGYPVLSPDGRFVIYEADQERDEVHELFATALQGDAGGQSYLPLVSR